MSKVFILYQSFFDMKGENYTVGGIQTYIRQLIEVIQKSNNVPIVVQFADHDFQRKYKNVDVYGVNVAHISHIRNKAKVLVKFIEGQFEKNDILIFATEDIFVPCFTDRVIAIQHGITWDKPKKKYRFLTLEFLRKNISSYRHLRRMKLLKNIVCVDYNFINWFRTQVCFVNKNLVAIPNCTRINENIPEKEKEKIQIIFARRFHTYRGTRIFAHVIIKILDKYDNVYVTFAGSGPDELYLKELFQDKPEVNFMTYESERSLEVHEKYHIAVIPTLGSEGTSLSLLEAMASKCAVVATNVGGMTNIILDNYNGLLISPNEKQLYEAIEKLIVNEDLRDRLAENAYQTVSQAFNNDLWQKRWIKFFDELNL